MISVTLITAVVVGLIAGFIADRTLTKGYGLPTNLTAGAVGAVAVPYLLSLAGITLLSGSIVSEVLTAAIGATAMFLVLKFFAKA